MASKKTKKPSFISVLLVGFCALALGGLAAYVSVGGLVKLFPATVAALLFGGLELTKLVTASYLHNNWKFIGWLKKIYFTAAVIIMICITSAGLYSFLSDAYAETAANVTAMEQRDELSNMEKKNLEEKVVSYKDLIDQKKGRIDVLTDQREKQETRLDSLYDRRAYNSAKRTETLIKEADIDIKNLSIEVDSLNAKIVRTQDNIYDIDNQMIQSKIEDGDSEVATFVAIAELTGQPLDKIVNILILVLVLIFDPLAILLLTQFNALINRRREHEDEPEEIKEKMNWKFWKKKREEKTSEKIYKADSEGNVVAPEQEVQVAEENQFEPSPDNSNQPVDGPAVIKENGVEISQRISAPEEILDPIEYEEEIYTPEIDEEIIEKFISPETKVVETEAKRKTEDDFVSDEEIDEEEEMNENAIVKKAKANRALYQKLLDIIYESGKKKAGETFKTYDAVLSEVKESQIKVSDRELNDFFLVCALFRIIQVEDKQEKQERKLLKSYEKAKKLLVEIGS